jgi:hypothetical protein
MATTVKIRRSGTATATPSSLEHGEIAINYADGKVFWKDASNVITSFTFQSYALASHTHGSADITVGNLGLNYITTNDPLDDVLGSIDTALGSIGASQITTGTLDAARLPLATTGAAGAVIVGTGLGVSSGTVSVTYGTSSGTACEGNDTRLSDTRTPTDGTVSTAKIQDAAVTYAKIQNVSTTDRLLGRSTAGAGVVEEITCTAFGRSLIDDADAAAARTTLSVQPTASPAFTGAATFDNSGNVVPVTITNTGTANSFVVNDASGDTSPFVIDAAGVVTCGGQLLVTAGSVSACSVAPTGDPNTGLYFPAANVAAIVTDGTERVRVSSSGNVTIGSANNSNTKLTIAGASANISGSRATYEGTLQINEAGEFSLAATGGLEFKGSVFGSGYGVKLFGADDGALIVGNRANSATWSESLRITQNREVLIGTTTDNGAYLLQVNSQIYATNATIATSDARFKTNVESLTDATSVIEALRPVAFDFIPQEDRNFATERQVGLIAQEAQEALAGTDYADSVVAQCGDHLGLAYEKLVPVLIKALQESNARIAALEERINA